MPYIIILIGLAFISISLYQGKDLFKKKSEQPQDSFNEILAENIKTSEMQSVINHLEQMEQRIEEMENSLLLINDSPYINNNLETQIPYEAKNYDDNKSITEASSKGTGNTINEKIFHMYDEGKTIEEICSKLNLGKGEVSLRLGLRKNKD